MVVDFDGRIVTQARPGPGECIVVAPINVDTLRHARKSRRAHQMQAHLRTECYPMYQTSQYPPHTLKDQEELTVTQIEQRIDAAKTRIGYLKTGESALTANIQDLLDILKNKGSESS